MAIYKTKEGKYVNIKTSGTKKQLEESKKQIAEIKAGYGGTVPKQQFDMSGKVEELSPSGEVVKTEYYAEGKNVGVSTQEGITVPPEVKSAVLKFDTQEGKEVVEINKQGATITTTKPVSYPVVMVNGQGYSVAPELQDKFISNLPKQNAIITTSKQTTEYDKSGKPLYSGEVSSAQPLITNLALLGAGGYIPKAVRVVGGTIFTGIGVKGALNKEAPIQEKIAYIALGALGVKSAFSGGSLFIKSKPTPPPKTSFIATIEREGELSNVNVLSKTGKDLSISTEKVMNVPDTDIFLGGGKGFRGEGNKIYEFQVLGSGKELGTSSIVSYMSPIKVSKEVGTGVISKSFQRDTGRVLEETKSGIKFIQEKKSPFTSQNVLGTITEQTEEGFSSFLGTSQPKIRVYKKGGVSYIIREPNIKGDIYLVSPEVERVNVLSAGTGSKTPFSKTFGLTTIEQKSVLSQISIPKVTQSVVKPSKLNIFGTNAVQVQDNLPSMVGGTGLTSLPYSSTGQYERTESKSVFVPISKTNQRSFNEERVNFLQPTKTVQDVFQVERQNFIQPTKEIQKEIVKENEAQKFLQIQVTKQPQLQKQRQSVINWFSKVKKTVGKTEGGDTFTILGRRFGKFKEIGKTTSKKESEDILKGFLKKGLGASGKILREGKALKFGEVMRGYEFGNEYTAGKKDITLIVQKPQFRLSTGGEKAEIKMFKNKAPKKSKKKSKLGWFD